MTIYNGIRTTDDSSLIDDLSIFKHKRRRYNDRMHACMVLIGLIAGAAILVGCALCFKHEFMPFFHLLHK